MNFKFSFSLKYEPIIRVHNSDTFYDINFHYHYLSLNRNQKIFNHSNIYSWEVFADLDNFDFTVHLDMLELQMIGQYQAEGYYMNETIAGSGMFEIRGEEA